MKLLPLMGFVPALTPRFSEPRHLAPFVDAFERIGSGESLECVVSAPPRHGKTETLKHALVWLLLSNPDTRIAYVTYSQIYSEKRSREIRDLYIRAGGNVEPESMSRRDWRTSADGGGLWATSPGGPLTGEGFDVVLIDDPVKDRASAESGIEREKLIEWFKDTLYTRREPGGSVVVTMTRWHVADLAGHLLGEGWYSIVLPAISSEGEALCPERYSLAQLTKIRETIGEYGWSSLYQGNPIPRGGALFQDWHAYDSLPIGLRIRIGADFAYSTKARSDWSVAVVLGEYEGKTYVLEVVRAQLSAPDFLSRLVALQAKYNAPIHAYIAGQEGGVIDSMRKIEPSLRIVTKPATADKFTRAQPVAAAWCAGKVLLPRSAPWLNSFITELVAFTGIGDRNDDQIDALAAAFDAVAGAVGAAAHAARVQEHRERLNLVGLMMVGGAGSADVADARKAMFLRRMAGVIPERYTSTRHGPAAWTRLSEEEKERVWEEERSRGRS